MRSGFLIAVLILGTGASAASAWAETCGAENLLAGRLPVAGATSRGAPAVATDGVVGPEGALWDSAVAVVLSPSAARLTWDLGREVEVRAFVLQADANDRYRISGSLDGREFERLGEIGEVPGRDGLVTRPLSLAARRVRFLSLEPLAGDGLYSLSELQAFCSTPSPWPPALRVVDAPQTAPPRTIYTYWNDTTSRWWELILALAGLALLVWDLRRERHGGSAAARRWRDRALATAGLLAALTYFNFGFFHFGNYIHGWDVFHYYIGAKYFPELGYERLYECVAVADAEEPALRPRVEARKITNLRTNELEPTRGILTHPQRCTSHFSAVRWRDFRHDVAWFRDRETPQRWDDLSADHGYNATPVWTLAGSLLAGTGPASDRQILLLTLLDPLYFLALLAVAGWAFGWRGLAVALLVFATFFPCRFFWTGGAFLRWDWLFYTVAAVACLRRQRPLLGGVALGYAALLRIFPGFLAIGPLVAILGYAGPRLGRALSSKASRRRALGAALREAFVAEPTRSHLRFLAGAALATALLVPASLAVAGPDAYRGFLGNSLKHAGTPLTNNMGLRMVLTFRADEVGRKLVDDRAAEPWRAWKEARLRAWKGARMLAAFLALAFVALLARATRRQPEPWIAAALGTLFIAFAADLTSYYYAFIFVPALLWTRRRMVGPLLLALCAFSTFVSLAPLPGMPTWRDEQYTLISFATLLAFVAILVAFAKRPPAADLPTNETAAEVAPRGRKLSRHDRRRKRR
jgi:hypothetical protein